jgi:hypothetical protein
MKRGSTYYRLLYLAAEGREPYGQFWEGIEDANAEVEARLTQLVEAQAPSDWRAAAFILERRFQDRWKKRETVDETVTVKLDEELERRLLRCRELNAKGLKP